MADKNKEIDNSPAKLFAPAMALNDAIALFNQITAFCKEKMVADIDYGLIPGTKKPVLYKSGGEKLNLWFNFKPVFDVRVETIDYDDIKILSVDTDCELIDGNGNVRGWCSANCNSAEEKYSSQTKWFTAAKIPPGFNRDELESREHKSRYDDGPKTYKVYAVTTTPKPYSLLNTIKKMSQKRAFLGAILMATGTSQVFAESTSDDSEDSKSEKSENGNNKKKALKLTSKLYNDGKLNDGGLKGWNDTIEAAKPNALEAIMDSLKKLDKKPAPKKTKKTDFEYHCGCIHPIDDKKKPYTECPDHKGKGIKSQGPHKDNE